MEKKKTIQKIESNKKFVEIMNSINKFEKSCSKTDILCTICSDPITSYLIRLRSKHKFHKKCINIWYLKNNKQKKNCIFCRDEKISRTCIR